MVVVLMEVMEVVVVMEVEEMMVAVEAVEVERLDLTLLLSGYWDH